MNILKEQIKLSVAYPGWRSAIKKLRLNKNKKIFFIWNAYAWQLGRSCNRNSRTIFF